MKPGESDEKVSHVFTVRNRPVGYRTGKWSGSLVAIERGDFPISPTGFRSLSGTSESAVTPAFLESLAVSHERERESVLARMHEARQPVGIPILNYIHASGAYEQGMLYGFFANDRDRRALWNAAHQLLCMVDSDPRFQPVPKYTYVAWTQEQCAKSLAQAREFKALLTKLAAGEFPKEMPIRMIGANAYLTLPPKPGGEPKVELSGYTAEMSLDEIPVQPVKRPRPARSSVSPTPPASPPPESQLGLFDSPTVATKPVGITGSRPSAGLSC